MSTIAARPASERGELAAELRQYLRPGQHRLALKAQTFRARRNGDSA